jgi:hypothetical protein
MDKNLVAFCGLYCGDCAGYSGEIANAANAPLCIMKRYDFTRTARSLFSDDLADMDGFLKKLTFMTTLRCTTVCRQKTEGETKCAIRTCCCEKEFYACHECECFERCETLMRMEDLHGDSCIKNLLGIKSMGLEQ